MNNIADNLCMVISNANENATAFETIDVIAEVGFKNVFIQWYNRDWVPSQEEQLEYIRKKGLNITFAHLGYDHINDIWLEDGEYSNLIVDNYKRDLDICYKNKIDMVIMHTHGKTNPPLYNEIGLKRFKEIVDYAEKLNIKVAIENTKVQGYLEYLIDNISNENLGICFDSGHYHTHFNDQFNFEKFKDKIFAIHLHDNDTSKDQHLLPFDGTLDFDSVLKQLNECNYSGPITLEVVYRRKYLEMSINDFYKKAFDIGNKIYEMYEMKKSAI